MIFIFDSFIVKN